MASNEAFTLNYGVLDRWIHRLAFSSRAVQAAAADVEDSLFGARFREVHAGRPIFLTSLPRAGTTLVLQILTRFGSLASQTYRDMPFVLAPVLWSAISSPFQTTGKASERAHRDGVPVSYDSPEAFEEVFWRTSWPEKYHPDRIDLWTPDDASGEVTNALSRLMQKVIVLRRPERPDDGRYVSKNNANIARLPLLPRMFPDATILVPFRNPVEHAASLLRQHRNFLGLHERQPFVRRYMEDLGHFEFGQLHRPIAFPRFAELTGGRDPLSFDYWLGYWIAAFEHVLEHRNSVIVVSYEALCSLRRAGLSALARTLGIPEEGALDDAVSLIRSPSGPAPPDPPDTSLGFQAHQVHERLLERYRLQ